MGKIDILLVGDNNLETVGGEQESIKIIIKGIKDHYSIGVIQPGEINNPFLNVKYYKLTESTRLKHEIKKPISFLRYIFNVKKIIDKSEPTIIHTQAQVSFFIVSLLLKLKLISSNIKLIHTERSLYIKYSNLFKKIFFFFMEELNILVTTTNFNIKYWKEALEANNLSLNYKVIENTPGEIFEVFDPNLVVSNKNVYTVGFSGRYHEVKNWPLAMEISEKLNNELNKKVKIRMNIGCLDNQSLIETKKMFKKMKGLLGDRFIGKINVDIKEMDNFYYNTDFFILTSHKNGESFGRTLVEAMSRDTIVLTTEAGGPEEVVGNYMNVLKDSDEFVNRIIEFINNKETMRKEKNKNMERVKKNYSLENNLNKHIEIYDSILRWKKERVK